MILILLAYVFLRSGRPLSIPQERIRTMVVLGSADMHGIVMVLQKERFSPRCYVAAATDSMSLQKAMVWEDSMVRQGKIICNGPRSCTPICIAAGLFKALDAHPLSTLRTLLEGESYT